MDETFLKLSELYEEMYVELSTEINALNGTVDKFSYSDMSIHITVAPELQEYAANLVSELSLKYDKKRREIMSKDPFIGVKTILLEHSDPN
jgi:hypothetical protein